MEWSFGLLTWDHGYPIAPSWSARDTHAPGESGPSEISMLRGCSPVRVEPGSGPPGDRLRDRTTKAQMSACMAFRLDRGRLEGRIRQSGVSHRVLGSDLRQE